MRIEDQLKEDEENLFNLTDKQRSILQRSEPNGTLIQHMKQATLGGENNKQTGLPERTGIDVSLADADFLCTAYAFSSDKSEEHDAIKLPLQTADIFNVQAAGSDKENLTKIGSKASLVSKPGSLISAPGLTIETIKKIESPHFDASDSDQIVSRDYVVSLIRQKRLRDKRVKRMAMASGAVAPKRPQTTKAKNNNVFIAKKLKLF